MSGRMKNYSSCASGERPPADTFAARYSALQLRCTLLVPTARRDRFTIEGRARGKIMPTDILRMDITRESKIVSNYFYMQIIIIEIINQIYNTYFMLEEIET